MRDSIRIGIVSSVDYINGTVQVLFGDRDNSVSKDLYVLSFEYDMPSAGDHVLCAFLPHGGGEGFCLGKYFNNENKPVETGNVYRKDIMDEAYFKYEKSTKTLIISADNIRLDGNIDINGDLVVSGNINALGSVTASNIP